MISYYYSGTSSELRSINFLSRSVIRSVAEAYRIIESLLVVYNEEQDELTSFPE